MHLAPTFPVLRGPLHRRLWNLGPPWSAAGMFTSEAELSSAGFPESVLQLLRRGAEGAAIKLAVAHGTRNELALTNLVFFTRHPERRGRKLSKGEPRFGELSQEWMNIRARLVLPALKNAAPRDTTVTPKVPSATPSLVRRDDQPFGSTLYVNIFLGRDSAARPITGIFIPQGYVPRPKVDLVLYLHGHKTTRVCGPGDSVSIDGYWRSRSWPLREELNRSGKNVVLVAPTLGPKSQAGWLTDPKGLETYIDQVIAALIAYGRSARAGRSATLGNIILASHSGGGKPMRQLALGSQRYADRIRECWGFDSLYAKSVDPKLWAQWATSRPDSKLYIYYLGSTEQLSKQLQDRQLPNVWVEQSTARNHCVVPIEHWKGRIRASEFLLDK
jgi:hypothetical protein